MIGRKSDEVDVLSTNDRQLLLCQITRGCVGFSAWAVYRAECRWPFAWL